MMCIHSDKMIAVLHCSHLAPVDIKETFKIVVVAMQA